MAKTNRKEMKPYRCFLGVHESHAYTYYASSLEDMKNYIAIKFSYRGRWYKQSTEGYPLNASRFIVKHKPTNSWNPVLIIPFF